jgi:hypothetical protein
MVIDASLIRLSSKSRPAVKFRISQNFSYKLRKAPLAILWSVQPSKRLLMFSCIFVSCCFREEATLSHNINGTSAGPMSFSRTNVLFWALTFCLMDIESWLYLHNEF